MGAGTRFWLQVLQFSSSYSSSVGMSAEVLSFLFLKMYLEEEPRTLQIDFLSFAQTP